MREGGGTYWLFFNFSTKNQEKNQYGGKGALAIFQFFRQKIEEFFKDYCLFFKFFNKKSRNNQ